jgi:hypothetical protein
MDERVHRPAHAFISAAESGVSGLAAEGICALPAASPAPTSQRTDGYGQ